MLATQTTVKQNLTSAAACHGYAEAADPERRTRSCGGREGEWGGAVYGEHPEGRVLSHDVLVVCHLCPPLSHDDKCQTRVPISTPNASTTIPLQPGGCCGQRGGTLAAVRCCTPLPMIKAESKKKERKGKERKTPRGGNEIKETGKSRLSLGTSRALLLAVFSERARRQSNKYTR